MFDILLAAVLILINGFFVAAEFALVKVRYTQLEAVESKTSEIAKEIVKNVDPYLGAVQLGITLASLGLGWIGEPAVARHLDTFLHYLEIPVTQETLHIISFTIAFSLISFLHIVIGEMTPKSIAIARPVKSSLWVARPMKIIFIVFQPFLIVLTAANNLLLKLLKVKPASGHGMAMSPEELRSIAQHSTTDGMLSEEQGTLLENVFTFSDRVAREIMVPRHKVAAINLEQPVQQALKFALENRHTRYPLYRGDLDDIVGVLHLKDLLHAMMGDEEITDLESYSRPVVYVPETTALESLLHTFKQKRSHMAMVVDEHGGVSGAITLEDTIEELVGEIQDEFDAERPPIEEVTGGLSVDGGLLLDELTERLDLAKIEESEVDTVSGYIMEQLDSIAKVGDCVTLGHSKLRVISMDRLRIERVFVSCVVPKDKEE